MKVYAPAPHVPRQEAMYEEFYRFSQPPFTLSPDPRFLYPSESHEEALTVLLQSLRRKEGFIVLTGDIGTGKTTVCRALLQQLDVNTFTSLVLNPFLSVEELVRTLHEFLTSIDSVRGSGVLIIDEAQHLSPEVLEEIRVISNLETNESKLLQIVLVGQLNLLDVLAAADMRQLDQRIALRATLKPLTRIEVEAYIAHRLWVAQGAVAVSFEAGALDLVHAVSGGVPRVINLLCDRSLMIGAELRVTVLTPAIIGQAAEKLALAVPPSPRAVRTARIRKWGIAAAIVLVAAAAVLYFAPLDRLVTTTPPALPDPPALSTPPPQAPVPPPQ